MVKKPVLSETLPSTSSLFWAVPLIFSMLCVNGNIGLHWTNFKRCKTVSLMSHESYTIPRTNSSSLFDFELPVAGDRRLHFQLPLVVDRWLHLELPVVGDRRLHFELSVSGDCRLHFKLSVAGDRHPVTVLPLADRQVVQLHPGNRPLARLLPPENQNKVTFTRLKNYWE